MARKPNTIQQRIAYVGGDEITATLNKIAAIAEKASVENLGHQELRHPVPASGALAAHDPWGGTGC